MLLSVSSQEMQIPTHVTIQHSRSFSVAGVDSGCNLGFHLNVAGGPFICRFIATGTSVGTAVNLSRRNAEY